MAPNPTPAHDRIRQRLAYHANGCWIWTGAVSNRYGVIQLGRGKGTAKPHRVMYEHHVGPIPDGYTLDHLCAETLCCNPDHLEPVTRSANTRRQWADGRADPGRHNRAKTHCPRGHEYDDSNTRIYNGRRYCRACARERMRAQRS